MPADSPRTERPLYEAPRMILIYAFWGWIGPFLIAFLMSKGIPTDQAVSWGGTITAGIILLGAPSSWLWGIVADKKGRTFAIIVAGVCSVAGEIILGFLFGQSLALIVLAGGLLVNRREGWISVSIKERKPLEKGYPEDVVSIASQAGQLKPSARSSLLRLLSKPGAAELLSALDKLSADDSSEDKNQSL